MGREFRCLLLQARTHVDLQVPMSASRATGTAALWAFFLPSHGTWAAGSEGCDSAPYRQPSIWLASSACFFLSRGACAPRRVLIWMAARIVELLRGCWR